MKDNWPGLEGALNGFVGKKKSNSTRVHKLNRNQNSKSLRVDITNLITVNVLMGSHDNLSPNLKS